MSAAAHSHQHGWQPGHIPKLSYRRAIPPEEMDAIRRSDSCYQAQSRRDGPQPSSDAPKENKQISISEIRKTLPESRTANKPPVTRELNLDSSRSAKKKNSLFSGLFAKEPTMAALAQVEADLVTKHGAATPQAVPHVSSRKLPQHVPKVNSKWDGLPDSVNGYGKEEERSRWANLPHSLSLEETIRSAAAGYRPRAERSTSSRTSEGSRNRRPPYTYPESSSSSISGDLSKASELGTTSAKSQSLRSPSGRSLPEISCFFPTKQEDHVTQKARERQHSATDSVSKSLPSRQSSRRESEAGQPYQVPSAEPIPGYSSSPIATPGESSPVTPAFAHESSEQVMAPAVRRESTSSSPPKATDRPKRLVPIDAFLAGEARPMELPDEEGNEERWSDLPFRRKNSTSVARVQQDIARRPDSSRQRLGLRAIKVVGDDATPWSAYESQTVLTSPKSTSNQPKKWSKKFGLSKV